jgi:DNA polymerase-1
MDASAFIHRAFHAIRNMTSKGQPTGAIYGFTSTVFKLLKEKKPDSLAVIYDSPGKNRRHKLYEQYKANRGPMEESLIYQQKTIRDIISALGLFSLEVPGQEADDIIAALCRRLLAAGREVVIVSGDKDFYQLLSDRVSMYDPGREKSSALTLEEFRAQFQLEPAGFLEMQGLMGDSSDNIPGVPGIGRVTAEKLIKEYGTIENLYDNLPTVKLTFQKKLAGFKDQALLSLELAKLGLEEIPEIDLNSLAPKPPDRETLSSIFKGFELRRLAQEADKYFGPDQSLLSGLPDPKPAAKAVSSVDLSRYVLVSNDNFGGLLERLSSGDTIALQTETAPAGDGKFEPALIGLSLAAGPNEAFYLPFDHRTIDSQNLNLPGCLDKLRPILTEPGKKLVSHRAKQHFLVLAKLGLPLPPPSGDPVLAAYLLNPDTQSELNRLAFENLDHETVNFSSLVQNPKKQTLQDVPAHLAACYAAEKADLALRLSGKFDADLSALPELAALYRQVELPLADLLTRMELDGILIDKAVLKDLAGELGEEIAKREERIFQMAGHPFNLGSPKQMEEVLFRELGLPEGKKTAQKTGFSTDSEVLSELAVTFPIAAEIIAWREFSKLKNTYADKLPLTVNPADGRIHTTFHQALTATGRLSSSAPNLQNIPARSKEGQIIRSAFIAETGKVLVRADYSQIELRVMANYSKDERLINAFASDEDIHTQTAAELFGLKPSEVSREQRREAKTINFGIIYGQSPFGLSKQLGWAQTTAKNFIDRYFQKFPGVKRYLDTTITEAKRVGFVKTWFGRRRFLGALKSGGYRAQREAERMAVNTVIQGTAADIMKIAMNLADRRIKEEKLAARIILQIHDELVVEAPEEESEAVARLLSETMALAGSAPGVREAKPLSVQLKVEADWGPNWAHK